MSAEEGYEDEEFDEVMDAARRLQKAMANVPKQAKLVSKMSAYQTGRIGQEMRRIRPPTKIVKRTRQPQTSALPTPKLDTDFSVFAGRRRKVKSGINILMGR
jgi:hypothetical protein